MERRENTTFLDVILLAFSLMVAVVIIILPYINPIGKEKNSDEKSPGILAVEIAWPSGWDTDVDLWVKAPGDRPVGYSNLSGIVFNLLRDDLGNYADFQSLNYENAYSRGVPDGLYIINLHLYANREGKYPVPVNVRAWKTDKSTRTTFLEKQLELNFIGQELTVLRFRVVQGEVDQKSFDQIQTPIRSGEK